MYEAAERHDLPIGIHFGGWGGMPITGAGWPVVLHRGPRRHGDRLPGAGRSSLVCEGVFERFPTLKVVLIEGGFAWLPPLMWRLDRAWRLLRDEVPQLTRLPSEYDARALLAHDPADGGAARRRADFHELLEQLGMDDRLMFATDYPHWDFDSPSRRCRPGSIRRFGA